MIVPAEAAAFFGCIISCQTADFSLHAVQQNVLHCFFHLCRENRLRLRSIFQAAAHFQLLLLPRTELPEALAAPSGHAAQQKLLHCLYSLICPALVLS